VRRRCAPRPGARWKTFAGADRAREPRRGLPRVHRLHAHHLGAPGHDGGDPRTATGYDPAARWSVFRNMGTTYLYKVLPGRHLRPRRRRRVPPPGFARQRRARLRRPSLQGPLRSLGPRAARVAPRRVGQPRPGVPLEGRGGRAAQPRGHHRERAAAPPALPRHRPSRAARWMGRGRDVGAARLRPLLRQATTTWTRPTSSSTTRARSPSTPAPITRTRRARTTSTSTAGPWPTTRCSSTGRARPSLGGETSGPRPTTAASAWTPRALWNSVRSLEDWRRTRDLWDRCRLSPVAAETSYTYARADATRAYDPAKLERFTRELVHLRGPDVLVVLDRVRSKDPSYRKAWLLHGVSEPRVEAPAAGRERGPGRDGVRAGLRRDVSRRAEAGCASTACSRASARSSSAGARGSSSGRPGTRMGGLGVGPELAARPARRRPAARRPLSKEDVADVLARHRAALTVEPPRRGAGRMADGRVARGAGEGRRVPARARDRRPRRHASAARGGDRGAMPSRAPPSRASPRSSSRTARCPARRPRCHDLDTRSLLLAGVARGPSTISRSRPASPRARPSGTRAPRLETRARCPWNGRMSAADSLRLRRLP
jgi:hypothetical protein